MGLGEGSVQTNLKVANELAVTMSSGRAFQGLAERTENTEAIKLVLALACRLSMGAFSDYPLAWV